MDFSRKDLLKTFPTRFSKSELRNHFAREYENLLGSPPASSCLETITRTFMEEWKKSRKKETFFSSARGQNWLEKKLVTSTPEQFVDAVTPKGPAPDLKTRKPFTGIL